MIQFAAFVIPERAGPEIKPRTIAEWVDAAVSPFEAVAEHADTVLGQHGVKITRPKDKSRTTEWWIAARNPTLARLHANTRWRSDEDGVGGWTGAAQKLSGAKGSSEQLAGPTQWGTRVPLSLIVDKDSKRRAPGQRALDIDGAKKGTPRSRRGQSLIEPLSKMADHWKLNGPPPWARLRS